jgi:hypothetical protein
VFVVKIIGNVCRLFSSENTILQVVCANHNIPNYEYISNPLTCRNAPGNLENIFPNLPVILEMIPNVTIKKTTPDNRL